MENNQTTTKTNRWKIVEKKTCDVIEWMKLYHSDDETNKDSNHWNQIDFF